MLQAPIRAAERKVQAFSRRLVFGTAGFVCISAGSAFLTVAAWLVLSQEGGTIFAASVIGSAYVGAGLALWAIALLSDGSSGKQNDEDDAYAPFMHMAEGFAAGLEAGRAAREAGAARRA